MAKAACEDSGMDLLRPGTHHYPLAYSGRQPSAFHQDSNWGYSLVPLTVINGL